jgi:hypothetical protein
MYHCLFSTRFGKRKNVLSHFKNFAIADNYRFWAGPIVVLFSSFLIADHVREKVAFIVQSIIALLGHLYFMVSYLISSFKSKSKWKYLNSKILTIPTKANENFPYHVPTNRIGIATHAEDTQNFPHHREGEGGNSQFDGVEPTLTLTDMFSVENTRSKYLASDPVEIQ